MLKAKTSLLLAASFLFAAPAVAQTAPAAAPAPAAPQATGVNWGRVYRSGAVWHLGLVYIAFGFSYIIYMTFFTKTLMAEAGYTKEAAGRLFMTMGWVTLLSGRGLRQVQTGRVQNYALGIALGLIVMAGSYLLLAGR